MLFLLLLFLPSLQQSPKLSLLSILQSFIAKSIIEIPKTSSGQQAEYFKSFNLMKF